MAYLSEIVQFLDSELSSNGYDDGSQNGLQVESSATSVSKVALAVDAGLSILQKAVSAGCQLLITHHGLLWRNSPQLNGVFGTKIRTLIEGGCSLYTSHLPLDGHVRLGNNAQILTRLGFDIAEGLCRSGEKTIGFVGHSSPISRSELVERLRSICPHPPFLGLEFGSSTIKSLGVVSGGAAFAVFDAHALNCDAFITGEPKQSVYHDVKELGMNCYFAGHYQTEVFGVQAVGQELSSRFGVETVFIDEPTGI